MAVKVSKAFQEKQTKVQQNGTNVFANSHRNQQYPSGMEHRLTRAKLKILEKAYHNTRG